MFIFFFICVVFLLISLFYAAFDHIFVIISLYIFTSQILPLYVMDILGELHGVPGLITGFIFGSVLR